MIASNGDYTPVGEVAANEEAAERAFAGTDNDLRYHFNLPESLESTDRLTVSYDAVSLHGGQTDSRYGIEVYVNNVQVQSEIVIREAQIGQKYDTEPFTLADVNAEVGSGYDNIITLKGVNYNAEGGGNWMGIDYVQLSQAAPEPDLADGLIAYWPFDGDLNDAVGDSHGEAMGTDAIVYAPGVFGQGIDLDGIDQYVQTPLENEEMFDFQDGTGFSVSAWFRVDGFTKSWQALIAKGEGNRWRVHRRGSEPQLTGNGGSGDVAGGTGDVNDGEIHHLVLVSDPDGGEVRFYSDGELVSTGGAPAIQSNDNPMMIGQNPDTGNRTWDGLIDDVGIWDRPITGEEVATIYNGGAGTPLISNPTVATAMPVPGLIAYWPLDEITGETTPDVVSGYDMSLTNIDDSNVVEGKVGNAFSFSNADQTLLSYVSEGEDDDLPANKHDSFAISFWSKVQGTGQNDLRLFSESNTLGDNNPLFNIGTRNNGSDGTIDIYIRGAGPTVGHIFSTAEPFDGEWHHVVFVQNELARSIYVDGLLDDLEIAAKPDSGWDNIDATTIGGILRGNASHWVTGLIDEVGIWDRPISEEEVALIYNDGEGTALVSQSSGDAIPYVKRLTAGPGGFGFRVADELTIEVDVDSIVVSVDGADVAVAKSKEDGVTTVKYTAAEPFRPQHGAHHDTLLRGHRW